MKKFSTILSIILLSIMIMAISTTFFIAVISMIKRLFEYIF